MTTTNIYILRLEDNNYYVGYTDDVKKRVKEHMEGKGSTFTKMYKPINLVKVYENVTPSKVDRFVIKYMKKYGMDSVRGGSYKNIELKKSQIEELQKEGVIFNEITNKYKSKDIDINKINLDDILIDEPIQIKQKVMNIPIKQANGTCYRCMKDGHYIEKCREKIDKFGKPIMEDPQLDIDFYFNSSLR